MVVWRKRLVAGVCLGMLLFTPVTAQADALHDKLNRYQNQYNQLNKQLSDQKQQTDAANQKAQDLQTSLNGLNDQIAQYQANIAAQQSTLNTLQQQRQILNEAQAKNIQELSDFLKSNYENNASNYWYALFEAKSWSELFDSIYELRSIASYYHDLQQKIADNDLALSQQQDDVEKQTSELQKSLQNELQAQQQYFKQVNDQQNVVNQLSQQQQNTQQNLVSTKHNIAYVQEMIREAQQEEEMAKLKKVSPGTGGVSGTVSVSGGAQAIVNYALQFQGVPYVWGGNYPSGWDCSGFVKYVYAHFGVNLYRTSEMQYNEGSHVAISNLQPGDLVFFATESDNPGDVSHVGIYIGNDKMINAENPRVGTIIDDIFSNPYWGPRYVGARRIIK